MIIGVVAALDQRIGLRYPMPLMSEPKPAATCATTSSCPDAKAGCSPTIAWNQPSGMY